VHQETSEKLLKVDGTERHNL